MKRTLTALSALAVVLAGTSCESYGPNARMGTAVGGLAGAGLGAIVGHQSGRALEGAAIGAGTGAVAGGLIGSSQDKRNEQYRQPAQPPPGYYNDPRYNDPRYNDPRYRY